MEKSKTCKGKHGPLIEYHSEAVAIEAAWKRGDTVHYRCDKCHKWHLSPKVRHTPCVRCHICSKNAYLTKEYALRRAIIIREEEGKNLTIYPCRFGSGWHLTKVKLRYQ